MSSIGEANLNRLLGDGRIFHPVLTSVNLYLSSRVWRLRSLRLAASVSVSCACAVERSVCSKFEIRATIGLFQIGMFFSFFHKMAMIVNCNASVIYNVSKDLLRKFR